MKTPTVLYPTIIEGVVSGNILRLESLDGSELLLSSKSVDVIKGVSHDGEAWQLSNAGPFVFFGKTWGISHIQKWSHWGWLKVNPDCFHRWWFWRTQQQDARGHWLPGTERGFYFRKPFSWRWQIDEKQPWIWTKGYLGGHWD